MKKVIYFVLVIPMLVGMMFSCSEVKTDAKKLDGKWTIVEVDGEKIVKEKMPYIEFKMAEKRLHGNGGCNMFNSSFTLDDKDASAISFAPAAATMMACLDMETEGKIFKEFENVNSVKAGKNDNEMLLVDKNNKLLFVLERQ